MRIYNNANHYHNFFNLNIEGDRNSKIEFENRFDNDFQNYLNKVYWCKEVAKLPTNAMPNNIKWRVRDVEMAVFTALRNNLPLNVLYIKDKCSQKLI